MSRGAIVRSLRTMWIPVARRVPWSCSARRRSISADRAGQRTAGMWGSSRPFRRVAAPHLTGVIGSPAVPRGRPGSLFESRKAAISGLWPRGSTEKPAHDRRRHSERLESEAKGHMPIKPGFYLVYLLFVMAEDSVRLSIQIDHESLLMCAIVTWDTLQVPGFILSRIQSDRTLAFNKWPSESPRPQSNSVAFDRRGERPSVLPSAVNWRRFSHSRVTQFPRMDGASELYQSSLPRNRTIRLIQVLKKGVCRLVIQILTVD
jgi:hypothetical protein